MIGGRDKKFVYMDKRLDSLFNKRLLNSESITLCKTDGIKIRWNTKKLTEVRLKDGEALKMALPKSLYRFQRRDFFRSLTPIIEPILCYISTVNPANDAEEMLVMTLTGASLGGVGTLAPDHLPSSMK